MVGLARSPGSGEGRPSSEKAEEISLLAVVGRAAMCAMCDLSQTGPADSMSSVAR